MSEIPLAIGIDFGGTTIKAGVVFRSNIVDHAEPLPTQEYEGYEELIKAMVAMVEDLRARHPSVVAVGIGMPGFVDFEKGFIYNLTNVPGWTAIPLKKMFEDKIDIPVFVENDANCMAYAEWKLGSGRGRKHLVCIAMGTGVGGGIIINGQVVRGARYGAGEIGQTSIDYQGRKGHYGNLGSLEDYVGNAEIALDARQSYAAAGIQKTLGECSPAALAAAAHRGDPIALARWDEIGRMLATAAMNCCWLLNPEAIIIGGGVSRAGELLFQPFTNHLFAQLSSTFKDHLMVLPAKFGHEAGTIGAAAIALESAGFSIY